MYIYYIYMCIPSQKGLIVVNDRYISIITIFTTVPWYRNVSDVFTVSSSSSFTFGSNSLHFAIGVVKTAAKAFPDVAAQCQEKKVPMNLWRFCLLPHRRRYLRIFSRELHRENICEVKEDGSTFFKTKGLSLVLARCFKILETFIHLINTYRHRYILCIHRYFQSCIYSKWLVFIAKQGETATQTENKQVRGVYYLFFTTTYIEGAQISIRLHFSSKFWVTRTVGIILICLLGIVA